MDILDKFQKLVSTLRIISISIGLNCQDPQSLHNTNFLILPKNFNSGFWLVALLIQYTKWN
jgi:hypothetical protein